MRLTTQCAMSRHCPVPSSRPSLSLRQATYLDRERACPATQLETRGPPAFLVSGNFQGNPAFRVRADFVNSELERTQQAGPSPNLETERTAPAVEGANCENERTFVNSVRTRKKRKSSPGIRSFAASTSRAERTRATAPRARVRTRSGPQSQVPIYTGGTSTVLTVRDSLQSSGLRARLPRCAAARRGPFGPRRLRPLPAQGRHRPAHPRAVPAAGPLRGLGSRWCRLRCEQGRPVVPGRRAC